MVGGTPKPFACNHEGCNMTFTNEDHLNVHQKKHEMDLDLSLGNKPNIFVADQTPTPTRFLRNCEEVGLFQDLQNVNPFEETFRRAAEMVKTGSLPEPELSTDDTLHTPHVFPLLTDNSSVYSSKKHSESLNTSIKEAQSENMPIKVLNINDINQGEIFEPKDKQNENQVMKDPEKNSETIQDANKEHDYALETNKNKCEKVSLNKSKAKLKLKQALKRRKSIIEGRPLPIQTIYLTSVNLQDNVILPAVNTTALPSSTTNQQPVITNVKKEIRIKSSREDILERNRAAALRCREKRKRQISLLGDNYERVCIQNKILQEENAILKNEVAQLKALLLSHNDCSVTKAMANTNTVPAQLIKVQYKPQEVQKNRLVLPKAEVPKIKIQNINAPRIVTKNIAFVTPVHKSVIVLKGGTP